ncbi:MAG: putative collagen-binding domain-containing protein [Armatimonadota bacterium]|nr:putative collagen-binding domain-containing protein [Armatimonadota bacterium]
MQLVRTIIATGICALVLHEFCWAGDVTVHSSRRYFQDGSGKPFFFVGAYCWASVAPGYYNDSPQRYIDMIVEGAKYGLNYVRLSLGINALGGKGSQYWERNPTPVPFRYINGKADLDRWDDRFWNGLVYHARLAKQYGVFLHVCLFDGVDIRGGTEQHRWINSYWNVKNQVRSFYGDLDLNGDGNTDESGEFYRADDFLNNRGVGYYQRRIIDRAIQFTKDFDNVFFEVGNELLGSDSRWNEAVISYVKSRTRKAITQNGGRLARNADGFSDHGPNTPADVKRMLAKNVGRGMPFWLDPDGSRLMTASADDLRRAAWYSFAGGAAGWGGFGGYWRRRVDPNIRDYYGKLIRFIRESGVRFWEMTPHHELISNSDVNSCLANPGKEYVVYVLSDNVVTLDLRAVPGSVVAQVYDPKGGKWLSEQNIDAGQLVSFTKPANVDDWVLYVHGGGK